MQSGFSPLVKLISNVVAHWPGSLLILAVCNLHRDRLCNRSLCSASALPVELWTSPCSLFCQVHLRRSGRSLHRLYWHRMCCSQIIHLRESDTLFRRRLRIALCYPRMSLEEVSRRRWWKEKKGLTVPCCYLRGHSKSGDACDWELHCQQTKVRLNGKRRWEVVGWELKHEGYISYPLTEKQWHTASTSFAPSWVNSLSSWKTYVVMIAFIIEISCLARAEG